jgi:hypothetical protein
MVHDDGDVVCCEDVDVVFVVLRRPYDDERDQRRKGKEMNFVWFLVVVGICSIAAQNLVLEQHTALMNVLDGLGE